MLVNTVNRQAVEHIERSHPLRVTFCQIVVYCDHVNTVTCECVEEYRQSSYKSFTLTSSHFGNLTLVKRNTTEDLHIIVNHVPLDFVTTSSPFIMIDSLVAVYSDEVVGRISSKFAVEICCSNNSFLVFCETTCCILNNAECNRQNFVQGNLVVVESLLVEFINLVEDFLAFVDRSIFNLSL